MATKGRRLFDAIVLGTILLMAGHGGWIAYSRAAVEADLRLVTAEAATLLEAFDRYFSRHGAFPTSHSGAALDPTDLEPLVRRGYYDGPLLTRLRQGRLDAYESPDDRGADQEFWLELTLARDPSIRVLIARSDDAPLCGGRWCDGVYLWRDGRLQAL